MAEHKAAADVTVVPRGEEKSGFARWIEKNGLIVLVGLILISAVIVVQSQMSQAATADEKAQWAALTEAMSGDAQSVPGLAGASTEGLTAAAQELGDTIAGPWARYALATNLALGGGYDAADDELAALQSSYPDHLLNTRRFAFANGEMRTLPEQMRRVYSDQAEWRGELVGVFENPPPPADAPRITMETTAGNIVIALYPEKAPEHVANFLKHADSDFYVGTKFHRIMPDFMIQGGDPNSRDNEDRGTWGLGGTDYTIDHEPNDLKHFRGYLSAAKKGSGIEEAGAQFFITTGNPHHLNGLHTVFGVVESGMDVVDTICTAETEIANPTMPQDPVAITKVSRN